jgi:two-component system, OmpR family, sensor histidine kinase VicK
MEDKGYLYDLLVHDLRGPLSVVSATTNSLLNKMDRYGLLTEQQKTCLQRIQRNTKRAQIILNEILDVGRSEEHVFKEDGIDLSSVVRECLASVIETRDESLTERLVKAESQDAFAALLDELGVTVEISGKYEKVPFTHDRRKVLLIIENLVSNAFKYRRERMKVSISGETDLTIMVSDDGAGIPKNEQDSVYKRFMQCSNASGQDVQGLGLGLFCVKSLVETMGGAITLTSIEGRGTSFVVRIPPLVQGKGGGR